MDLSSLVHGNEFPKIQYILYSDGLGKFVQYVFLIKMKVDYSSVFNFVPE